MSGCHNPHIDENINLSKILDGMQKKINEVIGLFVKSDLKLEDDIIKIQLKVEKLENYIEMEDRITASDVLCRLTLLEEKIKSLDVHHFELIFRSNLERIKKLEDAYKADYETAKEIIFAGAQTHACILKCEAEIKELKRFQDITYEQYKNRNKKPHRCPVCNGDGILYDISTGITYNMTTQKKVNCHACDKGIIWS